MARPKKMKLSASEQVSVKTLYKGSQRRKPIQSIHGIVEVTGFPRRQVMLCLENARLKKFTETSYA